MTEQEAKDRCAKLTAESPERETHSWLPRKEAGGEWAVVKLAVPSPKKEETTTSQAGDNQGIKDDPRPAMEQNVPPWGMGL